MKKTIKKEPHINKNYKVSILTTIKDKNDFLSNTLLSIKNQVTDYDYNLCIIDDGSKESPLPIIKKFFKDEKIIFKRHEKSVGIAYLASSLIDIIPEDTDIVIYQSCDVIWRFSNTMQSIVHNLESNEQCVVVPKIANFRIPKTAWTAGQNYNKVLDLCHSNPKLTGEPKDPSYLFLAGMTKDNFIRMASEQEYQCDEWTKKTLFDKEKMNLSYLMFDKIYAIHQCHEHVLFDCGNADRCPMHWCNRKTFKKLGIDLPFNQGLFKPEKGTFEIPLPKEK